MPSHVPRCYPSWRSHNRRTSTKKKQSTQNGPVLDVVGKEDFIENNFDFLEIRRAKTPLANRSEQSYATLARAAGLTSSVSSFAPQQRPSSSFDQLRVQSNPQEDPPPLPVKRLPNESHENIVFNITDRVGVSYRSMSIKDRPTLTFPSRTYDHFTNRRVDPTLFPVQEVQAPLALHHS